MSVCTDDIERAAARVGGVGVESDALGVCHAQADRIKMVHQHIIAARSRHPIKDPIWPWIELVNLGCSEKPICHKEIVM